GSCGQRINAGSGGGRIVQAVWNGHESVHWTDDLFAPGLPRADENYASSNSRSLHVRTYSLDNPHAFNARAGWQFRLIAIAPAHHVQIRWVDRAQDHSDERFARSQGRSKDLCQFQYATRFTGLAKDQCFHQYLPGL